MKTVKIVLALLAAVIIFNSCKKEYAEPTITWTPDNLSQFVDFEDETTWNQTLNITFGAEAGISEIKIWKHVYSAGEVDPTTTLLDSPTGYDALTEFAYSFSTTHTAASFAGGVIKIVYEFEVTDASETPQTKAKEYTFFSEDVYTVTINVVDEQGVAINDATVTFNTVEETTGPYVFSYIPEGTFEYTVEKAGYTTVNVTDFAVASDTTITVEMLMNIDATWSAEIPLALISETNWAEYNGTIVGTSANTTIGFNFNYTDGSTFRVVKTDNCTGWVLVDEATALGFTTKSQLEAAFNAGDMITQYELPATIAKVYSPRYFVSKVGNEYLLVKYAYGYRNGAANTGNVVVFQYKD